jgi:hypothetical protein
MISLETVLKPNPACPVREIGDGLVIMAPEGESTHSLDGIGAFIWTQIDGAKDLSMVLDVLLDEYDVEREVAEPDLVQFVTELADAQLLLTA